MSDLKTQLSAYFDAVVERVDREDIPAPESVELQPPPRRIRPAWVVGLGTAAVVILLGVVSFWVFPDEPSAPTPTDTPPATAPGTFEPGPLETVPPEDEVIVAEGLFEGSSFDWFMTAWETSDGTTCARLGGVGCFSIPEGGHLSGLFITEGFPGGQPGWCGYGTVTGADSVRLHLADGTEADATVYSSPEFDVDFFVHCQMGDSQSARVAALAADGTVLDETTDPETDQPDAFSSVEGRLPDGTSYQVEFEPPLTGLDLIGPMAAIVLDLEDDPDTRQRLGCINQCRAVAIGVTTFAKTQTPTSFEEGTFRISSGDWTMSIDLYEDILDLWGEQTEPILTQSVTAVDVQDGLPAFTIQPPLRWATDTEIPLQMEVDYGSFVVRRGCGNMSVGCSQSGSVQVIPAEEVVSGAPAWNHDTTVTVTELDD